MTAPLSARLTIDTDAIAANWRALDALTGPACETAAVVKADAYGCGAARVAPVLAAAGARTFFVAMMDEGFRLRDILGPKPTIYVFSGLGGDRAEAREAAARGIRPVLNSAEQVAFATAMAREIGGLGAALQFDTGMNRLGMEAPEAARTLADLADTAGDPRRAGTLDVDLCLSHMACADAPEHPQNAEQRRAFEEMTGPWPGRRSLAATGATVMGRDYHYDLVRPGIGLYGGLPYADARPVITLEVPIIQIRDVAPGESVGYGATWVAERPSRIATVSAGYADGLIRAMGSGAQGYLGGRPAAFAGRVSMDLITLDVTDCPCAPGQMVELIGPHQSIDDLADAAGTIGYEILTSLGSRYVRA